MATWDLSLKADIKVSVTDSHLVSFLVLIAVWLWQWWGAFHLSAGTAKLNSWPVRRTDGVFPGRLKHAGCWLLCLGSTTVAPLFWLSPVWGVGRCCYLTCLKCVMEEQSPVPFPLETSFSLYAVSSVLEFFRPFFSVSIIVLYCFIFFPVHWHLTLCNDLNFRRVWNNFSNHFMYLENSESFRTV